MVTKELRDCSAPSQQQLSVERGIGEVIFTCEISTGLIDVDGGWARSADGLGRLGRFWWRSFLAASRMGTFGCGFCQQRVAKHSRATKVFLLADEVREGANRACEQRRLEGVVPGTTSLTASPTGFQSMVPTASPPTQDGGTALACPPNAPRIR